MFAWKFWRATVNRSNSPPITEAAESERRFCEAYKAHQTAIERRDRRRQHDTWPALRDATTARLKAEQQPPAVVSTARGWRRGMA